MQIIFMLILGYFAWVDFSGNAAFPLYMDLIMICILSVGVSVSEFHDTYKKHLKSEKI